MKRYISAILVLCLLLQAFGCYSSREITIDELQAYDNFTITTKAFAFYHLVNRIEKDEIIENPYDYFSDDWIIKNDSNKITLVRQKAYKNLNNGSYEWDIKKGKKDLAFIDIKSIYVTEFSYCRTFLLGVIISSVVILTYFVISFSNMEWD